jgi:hypothetical protein
MSGIAMENMSQRVEQERQTDKSATGTQALLLVLPQTRSCWLPDWRKEGKEGRAKGQKSGSAGLYFAGPQQQNAAQRCGMNRP